MEKLKIDLSGNCCAFHTIKLNSISFPCRLPQSQTAARQVLSGWRCCMGRAKNTNPCLMGSFSSTWVHSCSLSSAAINSGGNKLYCKCLINCTYLFGSLARVSFISETYLQALLASRLPSTSRRRLTVATAAPQHDHGSCFLG